MQSREKASAFECAPLVEIPAPISLEELVSQLECHPEKSLATLLCHGTAYLGCLKIDYQFAAESPEYDPVRDLQMPLCSEVTRRILTFIGIDDRRDEAKLKAFITLVQAQERRLRNQSNLVGLRTYTDTLFDTCPLGMIVSDKLGYITAVNRALVAMTQFPRESFIGKRPNHIATKKGRARFFRAVKELQKQRPVEFAFDLIRARGKTIPAAATVTPFEFGGEPLFLTSIQNLDILESRGRPFVEVDKQLKRSIQNATDCFINFGHSGEIQSVNPYTGKLLGLCHEQIHGHPVDNIFAVPSLRAFRKAFSQAHTNGYATIECRLNHSDGTQVPARGNLMRYEIDGKLNFRLFLQDARENKPELDTTPRSAC